MTNEQPPDLNPGPARPRNLQRITPHALLSAKRIQDPQIHPDGQRVAFVVTEADFDESRWVSHLWITENLTPPPPSLKGRGSDAGTTVSSRAASDAVDEFTSESFPPNLDAEAESKSSPFPVSEANDLGKGAGGLGSERQLTFSRDGESRPRWSSDGNHLAFVSTRLDETEPLPDDDEEPTEQVWALPTDGGEARKLTGAKEGILDYEWVRDTDTLIFLAPEPRPRPVESVRKEQINRRKNDPIVEQEDRRRRQFWRVDVEERKPHLLFTADYGVTEFAVAPDGARLCYITNRSGDPNDYHLSDLMLVELETGATQLLSDRPGGKYGPRWSPDGTQLTFLAWLDPELSYSRESLFVVDLPADLPNITPDDLAQAAASPASGATARLLTARDFDFDIANFDWCRQDGLLYALATVRTGSAIVRIDPANGTVTHLELEPEEARYDLSADPAGGGLVWVTETASTLPEIVLRAEAGKLNALTRLNAEFSETYLIPKQEIICWRSRDGLEIEGVLTYPNGFREGVPAPLIVQVHGGPKGRAAFTLRDYPMHPVWAAEGYAVLRPNFRGSEGYGHAFAIANRRDLGGGDYEDIMSGVDWCIEHGIADPDRLGVMGGSYGGYMTNWIIGHTERFKAAVSMFGIFHLQTDYSNSALSRWDNDYLGAYYWEDPEIYRHLSPGSYIEQIKTPTLILHGDDDDNTFISNSKELYQALRHRGVTTQFVHYPREGHGLREPSHKLDEVRRCLAWMDKYVRGEGLAPVIYRPGDLVPGPDGQWELCVTKAEIVEFAGQPPSEDENATALLEVAFTLNTKEGVHRVEPALFALDSVLLEPLGADTSEGDLGVGEPLHPVGVPLDLHGVRSLIEGEGLRLTAHPDPETAQIAFAFAAVFRVPKAGGDAALHIADFPRAHIAWTAEEDEEPGEAETELNEENEDQ